MKESAVATAIRKHLVSYRHGACALAKNGHLGGVTAKMINVVLRKRQHLVKMDCKHSRASHGDGKEIVPESTAGPTSGHADQH
jgi:hypothetical protein